MSKVVACSDKIPGREAGFCPKWSQVQTKSQQKQAVMSEAAIGSDKIPGGAASYV